MPVFWIQYASEYILTTLIKIIEKLYINFELTKRAKKLQLAVKLKNKIK